MRSTLLCRQVAAFVCCLGLVACGDAQPSAQPTTAPVAEQPTAPPSAVPATTTSEPSATATAQPSATSAPPSATPEPPTATVAPPTSTEGIIQAVTVTPAPNQPAPTSTPAEPVAPTDAPAAEPPTSNGNPPAAAGYVFPVQGARVDYGRTHHDYPASDIFCPIGSQFVAPIGGVVDYTSTEDIWDPATDNPADRGGISVAIVGDDGVRYYGSHLSKVADGIAPGVRVETGQLLGLTGKSGNARFTDAHLHFGISRPTTPDDWQVRRGQVQPYPYLRAWQQGKPLKPEV